MHTYAFDDKWYVIRMIYMRYIHMLEDGVVYKYGTYVHATGIHWSLGTPPTNHICWTLAFSATTNIQLSYRASA